MSVPKVAIVGRPNVGKSSLLNWLTRRRISVVDPTAGVTRDRVTFLMHEQERYFELIDTGGIGIVDSDDLSEDIERQIQKGIDDATVILFVVDGKTGVVPLDVHVAERLRGIKKPMLIVVNKCDSPKQDLDIAEFYKLAKAEIVCTSVLGERNRDDLIEGILGLLPPSDQEETDEGDGLAELPELKLARYWYSRWIQPNPVATPDMSEPRPSQSRFARFALATSSETSIGRCAFVRMATTWRSSCL